MIRNLEYRVAKVVPKRTLNVVASLFSKRFPRPIMRRILLAYARLMDSNLEEMEKPLSSYRSLNEFITRKLKPSSRKISKGIVSPCDGIVTQVGRIYHNILIQAKDLYYTLDDLLVKRPERFYNGWYISVYLPPGWYHRVHSPVDGTLKEFTFIPGEFNPVNNLFRDRHKNLYTKNQRVVTKIHSDVGNVSLIMIGASTVGKIRLFDKYVFSWKTKGMISKRMNKKIFKGEDIGRFELGSAVILLFEPEKIKLRNLPVGQKIFLGQTIGVKV